MFKTVSFQKVAAYLGGSDADADEYFGCWRKFFPATERNYWGGLESEPVTLYANGVDGSEVQMYVVIVVPEVDDEVQFFVFKSMAITRELR